MPKLPYERSSIRQPDILSFEVIFEPDQLEAV